MDRQPVLFVSHGAPQLADAVSKRLGADDVCKQEQRGLDHGSSNWKASGRMVNTGHGAVRTTSSVTPPSNICASPVRPWVPMTIMSACFSPAC